MELRHLRYLIAAAEEEHFGRAADRLCVTRSAVSQIIADLEHELGVELFERQAQRIRLTAAGRTMLPRLKAMMADLDKTIQLAKLVGKGKSGLVTIAYGSLSTHHAAFRAAIKKFHEDHPAIVLSLVEIPTSRQLEPLLAGTIDAGFMHVGADTVEAATAGALEHHVIDTASLCAVVREDHWLARRGHASLADLADQPLVMVHNSRDSPAFRRLFARCRAAGFEPNIVQEVSATGTQQDLVSAGVGIAVSAIGGRYSYPPDLRLVPFCDVDEQVRFQLGWVKTRVEPALQAFIDVVRTIDVGATSAS